MPRLGKKHFPYTKQGYKDYDEAVAKKKKAVSRKKKRK